ncbi:hemicentin-1-like [Mytilus californianus]|uniref:hemicentin-1-like n=1 Tax=Mytilus californianus TaxID=6549 RepID=UPI002247AD18|nr:hemicentin-1-like [Mytilus californianus]
MFRVNAIMVTWLVWNVLLVHVFCQGNKPSIVVTPYQATRYGTSTIVIQCTVSSSPVATSVGWKKVSLIDGTSQEIDSQHHYESYQMADSMVNPHLTITNIAFSHQADYICFATNEAGTGQSNYGRINVTIDIPSVTVTPEIQFPFEDTSKIIIKCYITSLPTASTVGWQRTSLDGYSTVTIVVANSNGKYHVDNSLEYPHLTINDISLADDAYYACFAINDAGKGISNRSRVDVLKSPLAVSVPVTEYSASIGSRVTLQCSITLGTATEVKWLKNNNIIMMTARLSEGNVKSPSLTINSVEQGDLGYYVCHATDGVRIVNSDDILLIPSDVRMRVEVPVTQYSPTLLSNVKLQCEVTGSATSVKWFKNNNLIVIANNPRYSGGNLNSPSLTIISVKEDDFGYYTCQVTNGVDILNADQIAVLPKGIPPVVSVPQQLSAPIIGQQFIIPCTTESTSSSLKEIQWIRIDFKGKIIDPIITSSQQPIKYQGSIVDNPSLVIHDYQSSDDGRYRCRAINNWGSSVSDAVLVTTESK